MRRVILGLAGLVLFIGVPLTATVVFFRGGKVETIAYLKWYWRKFFLGKPLEELFD